MCIRDRGAPDAAARRVVTATGSAGSLAPALVAAGVDAVVCGEMKYHTCLLYTSGQWVPWLIIAATACVVIWAHRANIARLRAGTENKIGGKKAA